MKPDFWPDGVPFIDEKVQHVGVSWLRNSNGTSLSDLDKLLVIRDGDVPLAVMMPYEWFLEMQRRLSSPAPKGSINILS